jgi:hypothetical protein
MADALSDRLSVRLFDTGGVTLIRPTATGPQYTELTEDEARRLHAKLTDHFAVADNEEQ